MNSTKVCSVCLSDNLEDSVNTVSAVAVFGSSVSVQEKRTVCKNCGSIVEADEDAYTTAMAASVKSSIPAMVEFLENNHEFTLGEIELSLGLSRHSLSKWKYSKIMSAPALALLRVLRKFPFVIEAAANNFSDEASDKLLCDAFLNCLEKRVKATQGVANAGTFGYIVNGGEGIGFAAMGVAFRGVSSGGSSNQVPYSSQPQLSGAMA